MITKSKVGKYFLGGVLVDISLIAVVFLIVLLPMALDFNGRCFNPIGLDTFSSECTFLEYLFQGVFMILFAAIVFWWVVIPLLIIPPLVGLILGFHKSKAAA